MAFRPRISIPSTPEGRDAQLLAVLPGHQDVAVGGELRGRVVEAEVDLQADPGIEFDAEDLDRIPPSRGREPEGGIAPDQPGDFRDIGVLPHPVVGEVIHRVPAVEERLVLGDDPEVGIDRIEDDRDVAVVAEVEAALEDHQEGRQRNPGDRSGELLLLVDDDAKRRLEQHGRFTPRSRARPDSGKCFPPARTGARSRD